MNEFELKAVPVPAKGLDILHSQHLSRDFPDNELKPLSMLQALTEAGLNQTFTFWNGSQMLGYAVLARVRHRPLVLLDYFAVEPELRDSGCGSMLLRFLKRALPDGTGLIIESEVPVDEQTQRRVSFYQKAGARLTNLHSVLFGVDYVMLCIEKGAAVTDDAIAEEYLQLYHEMLPETRWNHVKVTRT